MKTFAVFDSQNLYYFFRLTVYAKDDSGEEAVIAKENRLRAFSTPDKVFNFFASYQVKSNGNYLL